MQKRMGRPKVKKGLQKVPFPIRFTRDNVASFKRAARRVKKPVSEWVTDTLTKAASVG